ncbi:MAG: carboxymuconolactone decarboxylase family protein [Anaerolineaceae bacterium]|nr:carboxymuconolactone decarboxylase family protein [Anaerolineaceae bacterium]
MTEESRYERGLKKLHEVDGREAIEIVSGLGELGRYIAEFAYGDIYSREGLSLRDRSIATIAMLTAMGGREPQLKVHFRAALNVGLSADELEEIIIHTVSYAGFPTAINALNLLKEVLSEKE